MNRSIIITLKFEAIHWWPEAREKEPTVGFLANPHRHLFTVRMWFPVASSRQIEFIDKKREVERAIGWELLCITNYGPSLETKSCEDVCEWLMERFPNCEQVQVMEDGENGAELS